MAINLEFGTPQIISRVGAGKIDVQFGTPEIVSRVPATAPTTPVWGTAGVDPLPTLSAWDQVFVAGKALPGIARVSGKGVEHQIDVKKVPGKDGATFTDMGRDLARFTIALVLQSQDDWNGFQGMRATLQPINPTGKLEAVSVAHPAINVLGVTSLYFYRVGTPHPGGVVGTFEVELETLEYRQPKNAGAGGFTPKKDVKDWDHNHKPEGPASKESPAYVRKPSETNAGPNEVPYYLRKA